MMWRFLKGHIFFFMLEGKLEIFMSHLNYLSEF